MGSRSNGLSTSSTSSYIFRRNSAGKSKKRNGCRGAGEEAREGQAEETTDVQELLATEVVAEASKRSRQFIVMSQ